MIEQPSPTAGKLDPGRLWAGGAATAIVAALIAVVGILFWRGVLDIPVLAPKGEGVWGNANTVTYALASAGIALAATGLVQVLSLTTPKYRTFFSWIMVLLTAIAVVVPLSLATPWSSRFATAGINLVIGLAITVILNGVARSAVRRPPRTARQFNQQQPGRYVDPSAPPPDNPYRTYGDPGAPPPESPYRT